MEPKILKIKIQWFDNMLILNIIQLSQFKALLIKKIYIYISGNGVNSQLLTV